MRNIHQNLGFALGYNGLGIPVAAGVLYPLWHVLLSPMIAGAAMAFSSLSVVLNANRLHAFVPNHAKPVRRGARTPLNLRFALPSQTLQSCGTHTDCRHESITEHEHKEHTMAHQEHIRPNLRHGRRSEAPPTPASMTGGQSTSAASIAQVSSTRIRRNTSRAVR